MISEKVARTIVESMAGGIAESGGRLEFMGMSGNELRASYHRPADCTDGSCSMPAPLLQRMLEGMVEAQGGRQVRVVVTEV
jgi:hypothetical protein